MEKELIQEYENPYYPVAINFFERKKEDCNVSEWSVRKNDIELIVVNNGELRISVKDRTERITAGQACMIGLNTPHKFASSAKEDTAFFSVVFSPEYVQDLDKENELSDRYFYKVMEDERAALVTLDDANLRDESAIDRINDIIAANTSKRRGYEILTKGYICMLWAILIDYIYSKKASFNGKNVPSQDELRVRSAITYMQENYSDPITLEDIAGRIHVSRNECCRCFKRIMMTSPVEYLIRLRVFEATKILYKDPLSIDTISELSFRMGFNNTSYFNKMFKRYLGCTPKEFSKMLKIDEDRAKKLYDSLQESVTGML